MRLLFDHNLSPRLVAHLADIFPGSEHVHALGLHEASDRAVWQFAREQGYTIVSRDADFSELTVLEGFPPRVVWIRRGNCSTAEIEAVLRDHREAIEQLDGDPASGVLTIF